jgi:predicted 3-demethylubiquinone-9 3-methyltransferase (glyoxalase superfamily)
MTATFELEGQEFTVINGGPNYPHTPATSLLVNCRDQDEVDELGEKLSEGGEKGQCGWLTDRYGVSWQVVPTTLERMIQDEDELKTQRVMKAMAEELRGIKVSGATIHFTPENPLPRDLVERILRERMKKVRSA